MTILIHHISYNGRFAKHYPVPTNIDHALYACDDAISGIDRDERKNMEGNMLARNDGRGVDEMPANTVGFYVVGSVPCWDDVRYCPFKLNCNAYGNCDEDRLHGRIPLSLFAYVVPSRRQQGIETKMLAYVALLTGATPRANLPSKLGRKLDVKVKDYNRKAKAAGKSQAEKIQAYWDDAIMRAEPWT